MNECNGIKCKKTQETRENHI